MKSIVVCIGYVLLCVGRYKQVFACIGSNIDCIHPTWCHIALQFTFHVIFTVDTPVVSLHWNFQLAGWSEGKIMAQASM